MRLSPDRLTTLLVLTSGVFLVTALVVTNWGNLVKAQTPATRYSETWQATEFYVTAVSGNLSNGGGMLHSVYTKTTDPASVTSSLPSYGAPGFSMAWDTNASASRTYSLNPHAFVSKWTVTGEISQ